MLPSLIFELINNIKAKYSKLEMEKGIIKERQILYGFTYCGV